jgi:NitT/TauT family transport system substrate-binding protein
MKHRLVALGAVALIGVLGLTPASRAEVSTIRLAKQYGVAYLPLTVMQQEHLLEKLATKAGLNIKTEWLQFSAGSGMNEALLSAISTLPQAALDPR